MNEVYIRKQAALTVLTRVELPTVSLTTDLPETKYSHQKRKPSNVLALQNRFESNEQSAEVTLTVKGRGVTAERVGPRCMIGVPLGSLPATSLPLATYSVTALSPSRSLWSQQAQPLDLLLLYVHIFDSAMPTYHVHPVNFSQPVEVMSHNCLSLCVIKRINHDA